MSKKQAIKNIEIYCHVCPITLSPVKLNPPANLTVKMGFDSNLWYYWNQTASNCVEGEIRYRTNNKEWEVRILKEQKKRFFFFVFLLLLLLFYLFAFRSCPPPLLTLSYCPQTSTLTTGRQNYCINMPSSNSQYEVQVRSKFGDTCGGSLFWSDWSEPVVWGSNNSTGKMAKWQHHY